MTWHRLLVLSLSALIADFLAIMAVNGAVIPPLVVMSVMYVGVLAALSRWQGRRMYIAVGALVVLLLIGNLPYVVPDLGHPETFATFVTTVVALLASVVAIGAAAAAAMAAGDARARAASMLVAALLAITVVGSAAASMAAGDAAGRPGDVRVTAQGVAYPSALEAKAGTVGFLVENRDPVRHTFVIDGRPVQQELPAGRSRRVEVALAAGTYQFRCDVLGHERMQGTITVK